MVTLYEKRPGWPAPPDALRASLALDLGLRDAVRPDGRPVAEKGGLGRLC